MITPTLLSTTIIENIIRIVWDNNSDIESGYKIWCSINSGTYNIIATVEAGIETYDYTPIEITDNFNFKIQAIKISNTGYSSYPNTVSNNILTLNNPYNDVIKITAVENSEFKFNINKNIFYTKQDIYDEIDAVQLPNALEGNVEKLFRWITSYHTLLYDYTGTTLPGNTALYSELWHLNSGMGNLCGWSAIFFRLIALHYFTEDSDKYSGSGHVFNELNGAFFDLGYRFLHYKNKYVLASVQDLKDNEKLITEPLRKFNSLFSFWPEQIQDMVLDAPLTDYSINNLVMKMPIGCHAILPVKTTNIPKTYKGIDITQYANALVTAPSGITGIVEMPFALLQITGTGSVIANGVTYTLPADETTLKTLLQQYAQFYRSFEILSSSTDIIAEFLIAKRRWDLYEENNIDMTVTSGRIHIESIPTNIPVDTIELTVNKGDAEAWTLNHKLYHTSSKTIKTTNRNFGFDTNQVTFFGSSMRPQLIPVLTNENITITAGVNVIDQCFASQLDPHDSTFTTSLELTFLSCDESNCYYTLDGSTPDAAKTLYTAPFTISATTTVKWINIKTDYANSHVNSRVITKL